MQVNNAYWQNKTGVRSTSAARRGDLWFDNETLVWTSCDLVKNDNTTAFLSRKTLLRPEFEHHEEGSELTSMHKRARSNSSTAIKST